MSPADRVLPTLSCALVRLGFDTSGDGFLQAGELKYAWQIVTGEEMTDAEAQAMVESVDTDGNNEIDPDEFIALVRENMN